MELLRKYSAMFIPVGIALLAVVLIVAAILMGGSLKKQMATSVTQSGTLKGLLDSAVSLRQWEVEKAYQDEHQKDADALAALAAQASQRQLLGYDMFPAPDANETSNTIFYNFARAYNAAVDALLAGMKAGQPHTPQEMAVATRAAGASGAAFDGVQKLADVLSKQRAQSIRVYADPYAFSGYDYGTTLMLADRNRSIAECWYWQVAYWIQEDIAETIMAANAGSKSVLDAPVKRLLGISFAVPDSTALNRVRAVGPASAATAAPVSEYGGTAAAFALNPEWPQYVKTATDAFVSPTPTNRISDGSIDVVHFSFAVVLRASNLMPFITELCSEKNHTFTGFDGKSPPRQCVRNQITVMGYTAYPVDLTVDEAQFYRYGNDSLYRLNLVCEYIFDRAGYDAVMPEVIKNPPDAAAAGMSSEE
jgi:hypothetical protein